MMNSSENTPSFDTILTALQEEPQWQTTADGIRFRVVELDDIPPNARACRLASSVENKEPWAEEHRRTCPSCLAHKKMYDAAHAHEHVCELCQLNRHRSHMGEEDDIVECPTLSAIFAVSDQEGWGE